MPTLPVPESERKERGQNWDFVFWGGGVPKMELEGRSKMGYRSARKTR